MEWFEAQLDHESVPESARAAGVADWFPRLWNDPATKYADDRADVYKNHEYARDLSNYSLLRRIYSTRTVFESMVELWSNHLHIEARHFPGFTHRADYDKTIRAHALGSFADLLVAASLHPAMLLYLDNWRSKADSPNENHGRELLELHTVGRVAGYTEQMVKDSAKILSGWTMTDDGTYVRYFDPAKHAIGTVKVLGFTHPNSVRTTPTSPSSTSAIWRSPRHRPAGLPQARRPVRLGRAVDPAGRRDGRGATSPTTATSRRRCARMVASDEFWGSAGQKVRTAIDDVVATCRVLRMKAKAPQRQRSFARAISNSIDDTLVYHWPRPDGPPDRAAVSASTTRMLNSWRMHWQLGGGLYPNEDVAFRPPVKFLPDSGMRFDQLVDHMCRTLLGRPSTRRAARGGVPGVRRRARRQDHQAPRGDAPQVPPTDLGGARHHRAHDPLTAPKDDSR